MSKKITAFGMKFEIGGMYLYGTDTDKIIFRKEGSEHTYYYNVRTGEYELPPGASIIPLDEKCGVLPVTEDAPRHKGPPKVKMLVVTMFCNVRFVIDESVGTPDIICSARTGSGLSINYETDGTMRITQQKPERVIVPSGALAAGPGARAVGVGGVMIGGSNAGNINTCGGAFVGGSVILGDGDFVGRDSYVVADAHAITRMSTTDAELVTIVTNGRTPIKGTFHDGKVKFPSIHAPLQVFAYGSVVTTDGMLAGGDLVAHHGGVIGVQRVEGKSLLVVNRGEGSILIAGGHVERLQVKNDNPFGSVGCYCTADHFEKLTISSGAVSLPETSHPEDIDIGETGQLIREDLASFMTR